VALAENFTAIEESRPLDIPRQANHRSINQIPYQVRSACY